MTDVNKAIGEFERSRVQLSAIENQSQSLSIQSQVLDEALKELKDSKEKKVYKAVGNILILNDVKKVEKELSEQKETVDLRLKTVKKQEDAMLDKLNKLKSEIEAAQKGEGKDKKEEEK
ncbi:MAG TPA: prefoldin subunit [archaeon]|nr:prefoldin subunit [archaeon]